MDKLCLPCKLVLPRPGGGGTDDDGRGRSNTREDESRGRWEGGEGIEGETGVGAGDKEEGGAAMQLRRRPVTMQEALKTGAGK